MTPRYRSLEVRSPDARTTNGRDVTAPPDGEPATEDAPATPSEVGSGSTPESPPTPGSTPGLDAPTAGLPPVPGRARYSRAVASGPALDSPTVAVRPVSATALDAPTVAVPPAPSAPPRRPTPLIGPILRRGGRAGAAPAFAVAALVCLPLAAATTDVSGMGGLGLAGVLSGWGWAAIVLAVLACATELLSAARALVLMATTAVLVLCTTGMPSVVEPGARVPTAWLHAGFVDAIATTGRIPQGIDTRFSWAGFFAQWAWITEAGGGTQLDTILRWAPPVIVVLWTVGVVAIARPLLGPGRLPWVAAWLFCGTNWIEQDYFSPQATAILLLLAVLALVLGPLATRREGGWPLPEPGAPGPGLVRRAAVALMSPVRRPDLPPSQVLLTWFVVGLCVLAVCVDHQLTPFALGAQLLVLALAGRFWGRWLLVLLIAAELTWVLVGAHDVWVSQLQLFTGDVGNVQGSLGSALFGRLVGDPGQLVVKFGRVGLALATWLLALAGAWIRWRRDRDVLVLLVAAVPVALVLVQSYGGEVGLRILLYSLPLLAMLGADALRALARRRRAVTTAVAGTAGMALLFVVLVLLRGGNDSYLMVSPQDAAVTRAVLASVPPGSTVLPLTDEGPVDLARVADVSQVNSAPGCDEIATDPQRCVDAEQPDRILVLPTMDAAGVALQNRTPGWTRAAIRTLVNGGDYRLLWIVDGPLGPGDVTALLTKVPK